MQRENIVLVGGPRSHEAPGCRTVNAQRHQSTIRGVYQVSTLAAIHSDNVLVAPKQPDQRRDRFAILVLRSVLEYDTLQYSPSLYLDAPMDPV